jgi:hypothetical protein
MHAAIYHRAARHVEMTMRSRIAVSLLFALMATSASAAVTIDDKPMFPAAVEPGGTISVTGSEFTTPVSGRLYDTSGKETPLDPPEIDADKKVITFRLPRNIAPGRYVMKISVGDLKDLTVPGEVRVQRPAVKIESAHPTTAYRDETGGFSFALIGENFSETASENAVEVEGQGNIVAPLPKPPAPPDGGPVPTRTPAEEESACRALAGRQPCLWVEDQGRRIQVRGYKPGGRFQGPTTVRVRVGNSSQLGVVSNSTKLVLARMSATGVLTWTLVLFVVLTYTLFRLVAAGMKDQLIHGQRFTPWYAFFIDSQTNTYSLSKFQLFAFSFTFIFGYLYVMLCRWLVQWQFVMPDVPTNLAAMLGISGGATLAAAGATQTRGSKGGGGMYPSFSDFVTQGGQVVPERFQFFVWTIVACFGFISLLVARDPATIDGFPTIPDGLLYVMGVSAAAYVGGKVTRPAGPVIKNIAVDPKSNPVIIVQGENLSTDADFLVDDVKLPIVTEAEKKAAGMQGGSGGEMKLVEAKPQAGASDRTFASELRITVIRSNAIPIFKPGLHRFRIVNTDGQFAETQLSLPVPSIATVQLQSGVGPVPPNQKVQLKVVGTGFYEPVAASWTPAGGEPQALAGSAINSDTEMVVTVDAGPAGEASLKISAAGGDASAKVTVG